jgi:LmbE family N-acetylglucosaminyl deacetylase
MPSTLIIAPHADDEVLGCGGLIVQNPGTCHVLLMMEVKDNRRQDLIKVSEELSFTWKSLNLRDRYMHQFSISETADKITEAIKIRQPKRIFIPYPSLHQDHKFTYDVALVASRKFKGDIYLFEYPEGSSHFIKPKPNVYLPITASDLEMKINAFSLYESEIKDGRDAEAIRALAVIRGYECHSKYAEAYELLKGYIE